MARSYKPLGETSGKHRPCLHCFHCRSRMFTNLDELTEWCIKKDVLLSRTWIKRLKKEKEVSIYWCPKLPHVKPKILGTVGAPLQINCQMFDGDPL